MRREPGIQQQFHSALKVAGSLMEAACPSGNPAVASPDEFLLFLLDVWQMRLPSNVAAISLALRDYEQAGDQAEGWTGMIYTKVCETIANNPHGTAHMTLEKLAAHLIQKSKPRPRPK